MGYSVSLTKLADAKSDYEQAAAHFGSLARDLERRVGALRERGALEGGHGMTGHYQARLSAFASVWLGMMDRFVTDEHKFAAFLQGFADRLHETHDLYNNLESRNSGLFDDVAKSLDRGE